MSPARNILALLFLLVLVDQASFGIELPIMSVIFTDSASTYFLLANTAQVATIGYILLSALFGAFPFAQFFAAPVLGAFSDRYGRRPVLLSATIAVALALALFVAGVVLKNIPLLFLSRILSGVGGGSVGVLFATAGDIAPPGRRATYFGIIASAAGLGLILGPIMGGIFSDPTIYTAFSTLTPIYILLAAVGMLFAGMYVGLPETKKTPSSLSPIKWFASLSQVHQSFSNAAQRWIFTISFLFSTSLALFLVFGSLVVLQRFSLTQSTLSYFLAYFGAGIIATQLGIVRAALAVASEKVVLCASLCGCALGLLLLALAPSLGWLLVITPLLALSVGLSYTMIASLVSTHSNADDQGKALGINTSIQSLAQAAPAIISGLLASHYSATAPLLLAAGVAAAASMYSYSVIRRLR